MQSWDSNIAFSASEVNLFASLQTKATKFPLPRNIKAHESIQEETATLQPSSSKLSREEVLFQNATAEYDAFRSTFQHTQDVLRSLDLLLESHKQLQLLSQSQLQSAEPAVTSPSAEKGELLAKLAAVQDQIAALDAVQKAEAFIQAAVMPSLTASPTFYEALSRLYSAQRLSPSIAAKTIQLMSKCWTNTMTAMERVLDADLDSLEAYIDDRSYAELRERVLRPLLKIVDLSPALFTESLTDFVGEYVKLRQNSVRFLVNERLNQSDSVFSTAPPEERIMHLIERARLMLQIEGREFDGLFGQFDFKTSRNAILETVGNLMYIQIEQTARQLSEPSHKVSQFIQSMLQSLAVLQGAANDPFTHFLRLLQNNLFPYQEPVEFQDNVIEV